jgi:prepilin-type N-terminal cleavage/methylation domain-containing protein
MQALSNKNHGFTIVELVVVTTVLGLLIGVVLGTLGDFYNSNTSSLARTTQDTDTRGVLRSIENELGGSAGFTSSLSTGFVTPQGSDNNAAAWSYMGTNNTRRVLIGLAYATDKDLKDDSRMVVLRRVGAVNNQSLDTPVVNAMIYFTAPDPTNSAKYNLYRRTIVNPGGGTVYPTPFQKNTCSSTKVTLYLSVCKGSDAILLYDINSFSVDYYTSSNDSAPIVGDNPLSVNQYSASIDPNLIANAKSVNITVVTNQRIDGKTSLITSNIRISRPY